MTDEKEKADVKGLADVVNLSEFLKPKPSERKVLVNISLALSPQKSKELEELKRKVEAPTYAELIRDMTILYLHVISIYEEGADLQILKKDRHVFSIEYSSIETLLGAYIERIRKQDGD